MKLRYVKNFSLEYDSEYGIDKRSGRAGRSGWTATLNGSVVCVFQDSLDKAILMTIEQALMVDPETLDE